ncbi:intermembrane transport protein PqiB [Stenoxybacter acetivorans]|uniref:intermembrane transport protein PqiB n=1 Tax=Stenoxybacter acetivorans TaxID=422441 RepID=UPI00055D2E9A|nr:intermembrane transport protein PqiB [Stenoxybacter acetivorans]
MNTSDTARPPQARVKKNAPLNSVVWLIPLLALFTGLWLAFQHIQNTGPEITLLMKDADGIEVNNTMVKVLNVSVGKVTDVKLRQDEKGVSVMVQLSADVKHMIRKDTQFWIVKPRIDQSGITGLNTLVSGAYIAFTPGHSAETATVFQIADVPPISAIGQTGLRLHLTNKSNKLLSAGSPVLYGDINVGQVETASFNPDDKTVHYQIFINSPNDKLVNSNSRFWVQSGLKIEAGGGGIKIDASPIPALLSGAIVFRDEPPGKGNSVPNNAEFTLYNSLSDLQNQPNSRALYYVVFFRDSVRGLSAGASVEYKGLPVGTVTDVPFFARNDSLKLFSDKRIPVRIMLEPERMEINADRQASGVWQQSIQAALNRGLTASLESDSLITGQLFVNLSDSTTGVPLFKPQAQYQGNVVIASKNGGFAALQNQLSDLLAKFNALPLNQTVSELNSSLRELKSTLNSVNRLLAQDSTQKMPQEISQTLRNIQQTLQGVSPNSPLYTDIRATLNRLNQTLQQAEPALQTLQEQPNALIFNKGQRDPIPQGAVSK